ncbi:ATP-binding protein [Streptomyces sp. NPDC057695]|uniref:ATP-binding protein n=1 Tax=Streptomyces sp. NPDC057695 TaxID=3346217 RepID=UPI0036BBBFC5
MTRAGAARAALCVMAAVPGAAPALRRFARGAARRWELPEETCEALSLVVSELVGNVIRHSGSPDVTLFVAAAHGAVIVQVRDGGRWRERGASRRAVPDDEACDGRGLRLVEACTTRCVVSTGRTGTWVAAEVADV